MPSCLATQRRFGFKHTDFTALHTRYRSEIIMINTLVAWFMASEQFCLVTAYVTSLMVCRKEVHT